MQFKMSFAISFNLDQPKILSSGKGLTSISKHRPDLRQNLLFISNTFWTWTIQISIPNTSRTCGCALNPFPHNDTLLTPLLGNKPFENTVGKGEIARNEQFLLFPQCFLPIWITCCHFRLI